MKALLIGIILTAQSQSITTSDYQSMDECLAAVERMQELFPTRTIFCLERPE